MIPPAGQAPADGAGFVRGQIYGTSARQRQGLVWVALCLVVPLFCGTGACSTAEPLLPQGSGPPAKAANSARPALSKAAPATSSGSSTDAAFAASAIKVLRSGQYEYKNFDEVLEHGFRHQTCWLGPYRLEQDLVNNYGSPPWYLVGLKISLGGKVLMNKSLPRFQGLYEPHYVLIDPAVDKESSLKPVARDITGDGTPDLVLGYDDGSARGSLDLRIFRLDGKSAPSEIYRASLITPNFRKSKKDGSFYLEVRDNNFELWLVGSTADSLFPRVRLKWEGRTFMPSARLMQEPPPSESELHFIASKIDSEMGELKKQVPEGAKPLTASLIGNVIAMIYSGNAKAARNLLELVYPGEARLARPAADPDVKTRVLSRDEFWQQLAAQLKKSRYAGALMELNPGLF